MEVPPPPALFLVITEMRKALKLIDVIVNMCKVAFQSNFLFPYRPMSRWMGGGLP